MHNTRYIVIFVTILTALVALVLSTLATGLKPIHDRNEAIYNKKAILSAVEDYIDGKASDLADEQVQQIFDDQVQQLVLDMNGNVVEGMLAENVDMAKERKKPLSEQVLPMYVLDTPKGKVYIMAVYGSGLWDVIWGSVAVEDDFSTVAGAAFDHQQETPGLGAEIKDNPNFAAQFKGKQLFSSDGAFASITVRKGSAVEPLHDVDGISGATITSNGVTEMLQRGLRYYLPYIEANKK